MAKIDVFTIADAALRASRFAIIGAAAIGALHILAHLGRAWGLGQ